MFRQFIYLFSLETKLVLRNARSQKIVLSSFVGGFGLILYVLSWKQAHLLDKPITVISGFFLMNIFLSLFYIGYGQYNFSWNCNHFNFLSANKIYWNTFFLTKFIFLIIANTLLGVIPFLYILFFESRIFLFYFICSIFFNAGILSFTSLFLAVHNTQRIDISSKGIFANWQGMGKNQHLVGLPYMGLIGIAVFIGIYTKDLMLIWYSSAVMGVFMLMLSSFWLKWVVRIFKKNRYKIIEGFNRH
jgi:hypothetical protein